VMMMIVMMMMTTTTTTTTTTTCNMFTVASNKLLQGFWLPQRRH
jgi:hypothetical protein